MFVFMASYLRPDPIKYYLVSTTVCCDSLNVLNATVLAEKVGAQFLYGCGTNDAFFLSHHH